MAPLPNESSLYDACSPATSSHLVSWKDDPSPAVYQAESTADTPDPTESTEETVGAAAAPLGDKKGTLRHVLKESWQNPRYLRWFSTFSTVIMFAIILGFINAFGPLYMCFRRDLNSTAVETGWVASLAWTFGIASPLVTTLYQRFGPRKIVIAGALFCSIGILSSSFATSIWPLFVSFGLVFGFGVHLIITGSMSLIPSHFDSDRCALPTTLPGVGGAIGTLIYCPVLEIAFEHYGWRNTLRFVATLMFVVGLTCAIWYKRPASEKGTANATPSASADASLKTTSSASQEAGAVSVAILDDKKVKSLLIKQDKAELKRERSRKSKENYIHLAKDPIHWMFCIATMLSNVVMVSNVINLVELMDSEGFTPQRSAMFMSILSFVETGFRLVTGVFGDRLPFARTLVFPLVCIICSCASFSLTLSTCTAIIVIYVCVAGMGRAVNYSIIFSASIETFGHGVHQESFSMLLVSYALACPLAGIIPGLSFDLTGSYTTANYCGAGMWLVAAGLYLMVYFLTNRRNRIRMRYSSVDQLNNDVICKMETCAPRTIESAVTEKSEFREEFLEEFPRTVNANHTFERPSFVSIEEHFVVMDKISTV